MHIAYFSDNAYPELSGIVDSITITGKELRSRGHDICYVGPRYTPQNYALAKRTFPKTPAEDTVDGMPFVRLPSIYLPFSPTGQSRFAFPTGATFAFLEKFKPDIIHTNSPYGVGWEAVRAARRFGVPLVGTNHTAIEDFYPAGMRAMMRRWDAWYYNHCDFVTTPYAALIARMKEAGFIRPAQAQANPADVSCFTPPLHNEKESYKKELGAAGPVVLYTGRLSPDKRVDVVLRGIANLIKEFPTLIFVATGHGADEPRLRKLAQALGIVSRVRFAGFLPFAELARVYKAADVFAFMSTSDSQSISLMQAYASGVPAVCARARGLPDYTPPGCGFLVEPGDYKALAAHIKELLHDQTLHTRMSQAGIAFVKHFTPAKIADDWEEIYKKIRS